SRVVTRSRIGSVRRHMDSLHRSRVDRGGPATARGREDPMNRSFATLAAVLAVLTASTLARAADQTHKFLHNDFDKTHCWPAVLTGSHARTAPAMQPKTPGPLASGKSPGLSLLGDGISAMGADPQLAVSPRYALVLEAHKYVFYDRATRAPLAA